MAKAKPLVHRSLCGGGFRFSTKFQDDETDLLYYGSRYYNASTGRWPSRDPLSLNPLGEDQGNQPNDYAFVENNPLQLYDPLGDKPNPKKKTTPKEPRPKTPAPRENRCKTDDACMRCLLFHEGRGKPNGCLQLLKDVMINRAKELGHGICDEAQSGAYSDAKSASSNYRKCCEQNWCADISKINGKSVKPYNPDKGDMQNIDDFVNAHPGTSDRVNKEVIRFHDKRMSKPKDWSDSYVEAPTPECSEFKFYKKVSE